MKEDVLNSIKKNKKFKNLAKIFSDSELNKFISFYLSLSFDQMKLVATLCYFLRKYKYHHNKGRLLGTKTKAMPDWIYLRLIEYAGKKYGIKIQLALEFEGIQGSRGEDTVRLKIDDIDFSNHSVRIFNRKVKRTYEIPLNKEFEKNGK